MTQAILYGSYSEVRLWASCGGRYALTLPQNPLHFSFPPEIDEESLMSGASRLSSAILESGKCLFPPFLVQERLT
jgi:nuclear pore complex protein Nup133